MVEAAVEVTCNNCGAGTLVAVLTILASFASLGVAGAALWISRSSLRIAKRQHEVFEREQAARAVIVPKLHAINHEPTEPDLIQTTADSTFVRVEIGLENKGDKPARIVDVNVLVPQSIEQFRWATVDGSEIPGAPGASKAPPTETLRWDDSRVEATQYLSKRFTDLTLSTAQAAHVSFNARVPDGATFRFPIRLRVESDDLEEPEVILDWTLRVRRPSNA